METTPLATGTEAGPTRSHKVGTGKEVKLPCLISDQATICAFFRAPTALVRKVMPSPKLHVSELYPGTTWVGIACMEYRQVEGMDPYNEIGVMIPVRYRPRLPIPALPIVAPQLFKNAGNYFHRMPLTSPDALQLGVEMHGLRKLLADIRFEETDRVRRCVASVDGTPLLELEVKKTRTRYQKMVSQTYTQLGDKILRTPVPTRGQFGMINGPKGARLTLGEHQVAQELRELKLASQPLVSLYAPQVESVLAAPAETLAG